MHRVCCFVAHVSTDSCEHWTFVGLCVAGRPPTRQRMSGGKLEHSGHRQHMKKASYDSDASRKQQSPAPTTDYACMEPETRSSW